MHTTPKSLALRPLLYELFITVLSTCNGIFYMMSGELNLQKMAYPPRELK